METGKENEFAVAMEEAEQQATVAVSQLLKDLEEEGLEPTTIMGVAINLLAQAWCKKHNNKVPVDGEDYRVGEFMVSIYPVLNVKAKKKIQGRTRAIKKANKKEK